MNLNAWAAETKREIFARLQKGEPPESGEYNEALWKEANDKGEPQIGATNYEPRSVSFEFIYQMDEGPPMVFSVVIEPPERIVFLPVPEWVVLSIWHGEALGSFHFESDARQMVAKFGTLLDEDANREVFGEMPPEIGRA